MEYLQSSFEHMMLADALILCAMDHQSLLNFENEVNDIKDQVEGRLGVDLFSKEYYDSFQYPLSYTPSSNDGFII